MDKSPSNTTPLVEFHLIIATIIQIISYLVIQSSTNAVYCHTQIQLTMQLQENLKCQNLSIDHNCSNHYNLDPIAAMNTGKKEHGAISFDS